MASHHVRRQQAMRAPPQAPMQIQPRVVVWIVSLPSAPLDSDPCGTWMDMLRLVGDLGPLRRPHGRQPSTKRNGQRIRVSSFAFAGPSVCGARNGLPYNDYAVVMNGAMAGRGIAFARCGLVDAPRRRGPRVRWTSGAPPRERSPSAPWPLLRTRCLRSGRRPAARPHRLTLVAPHGSPRLSSSLEPVPVRPRRRIQPLIPPTRQNLSSRPPGRRQPRPWFLLLHKQKGAARRPPPHHLPLQRAYW